MAGKGARPNWPRNLRCELGFWWLDLAVGLRAQLGPTIPGSGHWPLARPKPTGPHVLMGEVWHPRRLTRGLISENISGPAYQKLVRRGCSRQESGQPLPGCSSKANFPTWQSIANNDKERFCRARSGDRFTAFSLRVPKKELSSVQTVFAGCSRYTGLHWRFR